MKSNLSHLLAALVAVGAAAPAFAAEKEVNIRHAAPGAPGRFHAAPGHPMPADGFHGRAPVRAIRVAGGEPKEVEKEKVAFLGVQTAPVSRTLATQLGLPRGTGLVVTELVDDSPAATSLQEHDILTKLDDQILVGQQQLSVLIRNKKQGDEVTLTVFRGGKESKVKVKLGEREVPKYSAFEDAEAHGFSFSHLEGPQIARLHQLPGMEPGQVNDVIRMIGRNRGNWIGSPGARVFRRGAQGATILDLPHGNIVYSDDAGSVEVKADDGKRQLTVKDPSGKVLFEGPVNSKEDREKLPEDIKARVGKIEGANFSFEVGEEFEIDGADVRPATGLRRIHAAPAQAVPVRPHDPRFF
jgi:serine protease Do